MVLHEIKILVIVIVGFIAFSFVIRFVFDFILRGLGEFIEMVTGEEHNEKGSVDLSVYIKPYWVNDRVNECRKLGTTERNVNKEKKDYIWFDQVVIDNFLFNRERNNSCDEENEFHYRENDNNYYEENNNEKEESKNYYWFSEVIINNFLYDESKNSGKEEKQEFDEEKYSVDYYVNEAVSKIQNIDEIKELIKFSTGEKREIVLRQYKDRYEQLIGRKLYSGDYLVWGAVNQIRLIKIIPELKEFCKEENRKTVINAFNQRYNRLITKSKSFDFDS